MRRVKRFIQHAIIAFRSIIILSGGGRGEGDLSWGLRTDTTTKTRDAMELIKVI